MSGSRITMLIVLILLTIGAMAVLGFTIAQQFPGYYWSRAESAFENEQYEDAYLHLQKLLNKHPDHDRGQELMSRVILREARRRGRLATYAANPKAVEHLENAARLRPSDMDLQRRLLRAYLQTPHTWGKAVPVAEEIYEIEPKNADANFVLTWFAVEKKDKERAEELFKAFPNIESSRVFETLGLEAQFYTEQEDEERVNQVLERAMDFAEVLTAEQLGLLTELDRQAMLRLLLFYQARAEDPTVSLQRAKVLVDCCFKLDETGLTDKRILANAGAQAVARFNAKFLPTRIEPAHELMRNELASRVEELGSGALESVAKVEDERAETVRDLEGKIEKAKSDLKTAKTARSESKIKEAEDKLAALEAEKKAVERGIVAAPMLVYWSTARTLMTQGKFDEALKVLENGLAAADKLGTQAIGDQQLDLHLLAARVLIMQKKYKEANKHLDKLLGNPRFAGWNYLLKGSVAQGEGRLDDAHAQFLQAKQLMGDKILVRMSLARTHMARKEWDQAIELLETLKVSADTLSDEEKAWHEQLLGDGNRVEFDLLRAELALGRWNNAKNRLRVLRDTKLAPAAYNLAINYLWEDSDDPADRPRAKAYLAAARKAFPDDLSLVLLHAKVLEDEGESLLATKVMEQFAAEKPEEELRQLALADWQIRHGDFNRALLTLDTIDRSANLSDRARNISMVYRAQAYMRGRQIDRAKEQCDRLIANKVTEAEGYRLKGFISFAERNPEAGLENFEKALDLNPHNQPLRMMLAKIKQQQGDYDAVLDEIADLAGVTKYQAQVQATVSDTLRRIALTEGTDKALGEADKMLAKRPDDLALRVLKVDFLLQLNRFEEAMRELAAAQRLSPTDPNIPRLKAQAYLIKGEYADALAELDNAVELDPQNFHLQLMAAQACIGADQISKGIKHAQTAVQLNKDSPRGYLLLAECFRKSNRVDDSIRVLKVYARAHPNDFAIQDTIAKLYMELEDNKNAIGQMRLGRFANPNDIRYLIRELELQLAAGRGDEARQLAMDQLPRWKNPLQILLAAQAFASAGQFADAQQWGAKALSAANDNIAERASANSFLGRLYLRQANIQDSLPLRQKAADYFRAVLNDHPGDLVAGNNLAWLLAEHLNEPQEAVKIVEAVQKTNGSAVEKLPVEFIDTMVVVYQKAGQAQKAQTILKQAVAKNPSSAPLLYQLGLSMVDGQPKQAKEMLSRALELGLPAEEEAEAKRQLARL